ncbi:hypothetical protein Pla163_15780 [Planctomycetes bacterium Pla163]|uniref:Cephalosporin hydroxylase n=1 Tax=Rohdeia mirabilis TaxID=2528008 RepID=A0A518CZ10_9BACT|nr:hypothetical protein Pla163_15780 [Planctomycetes bacterium Pla163]
MNQSVSTAPAPDRSSATGVTRFERYMQIHGSIDGWFSRESAAIWDSLLEFQAADGVRGNMLEIGVWEGKSAALTAMHARPGETVHLADLDLKIEPIQRALGAARPEPGVEFTTIAGDSRDLNVSPLVAEEFGRHRFIHIDGEHTARAVTNDLALANQLLAPQGVVVVDDFFSWLYPQITEAVLRYVRQFPDDFALFLCGYNKAYLARPHYVHRYLEACATRLPAQLEARGVVSTIAKTTYPAELNTFGIGPRFQEMPLRGPDWDPKTIRV